LSKQVKVLVAWTVALAAAAAVGITAYSPEIEPLPSGFQTATPSPTRTRVIEIEDGPTAIPLLSPTPAATAVPTNGTVKFG